MDATKSHFAKSTARPFLGGRGALVLSVSAAAAAAVVFRYKSDAIRENDRLQQLYKAPNGYVSVDRSGGGI